MDKLKVAYFGTPDFSATLLERLIESDLPIEIVLVVTQPDKPIGRDQILTPSPVKLIAQKYHIEVFDRAELSELPELLIKKNIDFGLLYSFGFKQWLTADLLSSPKIKFGDTGFGFLNIHPSLLPKYRGASPITFPILLGDNETGVSLMVMDEKMDHGPLLAHEKLVIAENDTTHTLTAKLTDLAFSLFSKIVPQLLITNYQLPITEQNHDLATFARFLTRDDGFVSLELLKKVLNGENIKNEELPKIYQWYFQKNKQSPGSLILNSKFLILKMHLALSPWPGIWTLINYRGEQKRLKIIELHLDSGMLIIDKVQVEGKNPVSYLEFTRDNPVFG